MSLTKVIILGVALVVAALLVPMIHLQWDDDPVQTVVTLGVLAVIFGVINAYLRPVLAALSLPINLISMGLFSFVLNAALLLLLAWVVDLLWQPVLTIGTFPPTLDSDAVLGAFLGSLVISIVSTAMSLLLPDA